MKKEINPTTKELKKVKRRQKMVKQLSLGQKFFYPKKKRTVKPRKMWTTKRKTQKVQSVS